MIEFIIESVLFTPGGSAEVLVNRALESDGTVSMGGYNELTLGYLNEGESGLNQVLGSSVALVFLETTATGGFQFSPVNSADYHPLYAPIVGGNLSLNGTNPPRIGLDIFTEGGVELGGSLQVNHILLRYIPRGGIAISGTADAHLTILATMSGGITTDAASLLEVERSYNAQNRLGRIFILGGATAGKDRWEYTSEGGITFSGAQGLAVCFAGCDARINNYFRQYETNPGCKYKLPGSPRSRSAGCVSAMYAMPMDQHRRMGTSSPALVPAVTVCLERLFDRRNGENGCNNKFPR